MFRLASMNDAHLLLFLVLPVSIIEMVSSGYFIEE